MKSRISVDLDWDNQPIITVNYTFSDDVRDKMVKRFKEAFGFDSSYCVVDFGPESIDRQVSTLTIRPISSDGLEDLSKETHKRAQERKKYVGTMDVLTPKIKE